MLKEHGVDYVYREYTKEPLTRAEVVDVLGKLGVGPRDVLRARDAKALGVGPEVDDDALVGLMAEHPGLLQRPIVIDGDRAIMARPADLIEDFLSAS